MSADPLPHFSFRSVAHDRLGDRRSDDEFLASAWSRPDTRVLAVRGADLAVSSEGDALQWVAPQDAPAGSRVLLGATPEGAVRFAVLEEHSEDTSQQEAVTGAPARAAAYASLRRLGALLSETEASFAVHAAALAQWHRRHGHCAVCGAPTTVVRAGEARGCAECGAEHFPRTDPAVIMTVIDGSGRCLLGHNRARAAGWFSTLAGFVEPGETPEQAVVREVFEEVGVQVESVTYLGSQPWPFPSQLMLAYEAVTRGTAITVDAEEITEARWFTPEELRSAVKSGEVVLPTTISIAGALISRWYGGPLPRAAVSDDAETGASPR